MHPANARYSGAARRRRRPNNSATFEIPAASKMIQLKEVVNQILKIYKCKNQDLWISMGDNDTRLVSDTDRCYKMTKDDLTVDKETGELPEVSFCLDVMWTLIPLTTTASKCYALLTYPRTADVRCVRTAFVCAQLGTYV
jgi:hypothetical protein